MHVLVTGSTGFVGHAVRNALEERGHSVLGVARSANEAEDVAADLTETDAFATVLANSSAEAVINLAAVPDIAPCTADPALARQLNDELPGRIAAACADRGLRFVHVSTDQVFDGSRGSWREDDQPRPIHLYGSTKLAGEQRVLDLDPHAVIVRPGLITGIAPDGRRSSSTGLIQSVLNAQAGAADKPGMFTDEVRSPIAVGDLATVLAELVERDDISGILHAGGPEVLTRYQLAVRECALRELNPGMLRTTTRAAVGMAHVRPADLSLNSSRLAAALGWMPRTLGV